MQGHTFTMFDNAQPKTFDFFAPYSAVGALVKPEAASKQTFHSLKGSPSRPRSPSLGLRPYHVPLQSVTCEVALAVPCIAA